MTFPESVSGLYNYVFFGDNVSHLQLIHECRVPDSYSVQIQYIDRKGFDLCICSTDQSNEVRGNTQMIVLDLNCSSCNIERHRRCNLTVLAESNTQSVTTTMAMNISTCIN